MNLLNIINSMQLNTKIVPGFRIVANGKCIKSHNRYRERNY